MLTTVEQNFYEIGRAAADTVIEMIENKERKQIKTIVPVKLIIRESVDRVKYYYKYLIN